VLHTKSSRPPCAESELGTHRDLERVLRRKRLDAADAVAVVIVVANVDAVAVAVEISAQTLDPNLRAAFALTTLPLTCRVDSSRRITAIRSDPSPDPD